MFGGPGHGLRGAAHEGKARNAGVTLRRLVAYFGEHRGRLAGVIAAVVTGSLTQLAGPYLIGVAIDEFIRPEAVGAAPWFVPAFLTGLTGGGRAGGLAAVMLLLLAVYLLGWAAFFGQFYLMVLVGQRMLFTLRRQIFDRLQRLSLSYFDEHESGDLMSRLTNDTDVINQVLSGGITQFIGSLLTVVGISGVMLFLNWQLALAALTTVPVMLLVTVFFSRRARAAFRRTRQTIGKVNVELEENISGVRVVQAFGRERTSLSEFNAANRANRDANVSAQSVTSAFSPALDVVSSIGQGIVVAFGGYLALRDASSVGTVVAFLLYVRRFYEPLQAIATLYAQLQSALAGAERIFELLDTEPVVKNKPGAIELPPIKGRVDFEHVEFAYRGEDNVLYGIDLTAEPGQTVALVGATGAGKTTIVSLLLRFYDVTGGRVTVDSYDVRDVTQASLRRQTGVVLQDVFLFSGTVMDNIRYGRLDATDAEVEQAARLARADEFIRRLPDGYKTELGERGANLSQGQRQLLAISRAILADPRILVLDEATSSVDTRTERLIQDALEDLLANRTSFVIAHRLSTIRHADQVLVIEDGGVVERGTHEELLARRGKYYDLYESQFREGAAFT